MTSRYLNYTRGTTLQTLCRKLIAGMASGADLSDAQEWIVNEQRNLRKQQTPLWEPTVSDSCYHRYLSVLAEALENNEEVAFFEKLYAEIKGITRQKIYALFLTQEVFCWPSLQSVFLAAENNPDYECTVIYTPFFHKNYNEQADYFEEYREMGVPVVRHSEYNLSLHSPDVVFMIKPYGNTPEQYQIKHLQCVIPRVVYIPYGMEITTDLLSFGFQYYLHYKAWRHCAYGEVVKEYGGKGGYRNGDNLAVWGHPKADLYRDLEAGRAGIPEEWKQIIGDRKVILWSPHHLIDLNENGTGTWLIWGEKILNLALQNPDIVFIFRPHPLMMGALVNSGALTQGQANRLAKRIENAENIIWDTTSVYQNAFYAADAIITDGTTFSVEFLYTQKPVMLTPRNMSGFYAYEEMLKSYYIVNEIADVANFIDMVRNGEDPLREQRLALYDKMFFIPETGTVGEHIIAQVKKDLTEECCGDICDSLPASVVEQETALEEIPVADMAVTEEADAPGFPLFSILVLCYKNMNLLFGMLDSIFQQDYPRIQLIVSDDGSADFDIEKVQSYIDLHKKQNIEQVIVRKNPVNMRTVRHVHEALQLTQGEYVVFTAADDRFSGSDAISGYVKQFLENPDAYWLVARCRVTSADYKKTIYNTPTDADAPYFKERDAHKLFSRWSRRGMAIPCCMAFRKNAFDLVGGIDLDYQFLEDWPLELKLLRNGHAPVYYEKITAIHSAGGISNSNDRYGKEIRRLFYEDKYTIFRKEVKPYIHLLLPEDRKAYRQYLREIMARHYFFYIDWPGQSKWKRFWLCMKKPIRFWWAFELTYVKKYQGKIQRKKMFVASQIAMFIALLFLSFDGAAFAEVIAHGIGWMEFVAAIALFLISTVSYPLEKYFKYKAKLRTELVN